MNLSEPWVTHTLEYSLCIHSGKKSLRYDLAHALSIESLSVLFFYNIAERMDICGYHPTLCNGSVFGHCTWVGLSSLVDEKK